MNDDQLAVIVAASIRAASLLYTSPGFGYASDLGSAADKIAAFGVNSFNRLTENKNTTFQGKK